MKGFKREVRKKGITASEKLPHTLSSSTGVGYLFTNPKEKTYRDHSKQRYSGTYGIHIFKIGCIIAIE